jgi:hypothetical protein
MFVELPNGASPIEPSVNLIDNAPSLCAVRVVLPTSSSNKVTR